MCSVYWGILGGVEGRGDFLLFFNHLGVKFAFCKLIFNNYSCQFVLGKSF